MAERRMFTKKVTDDDNFMALSGTAQALYLHLSMAADDDGFCNQVSVSMFKAHASIQDLEALLMKRFIYQFDNGVIVIKHWRMANALRKDRYTPTAFQEELSRLDIKENGSYTWQPNGNQTATGGCHSIEENRLDKVNKESRKKTPTLEEITAYAIEKNMAIDPKTFFDYYEVNAWKDVKNWKQKMITWNSHQNKTATKKNNFHNFEERNDNPDADVLANFDKMMNPPEAE